MATAMRTGVIRYNLKDRMRQFNGQERHFDVPKLVAEINSPKVQERVRLGDLNGFYGHWARTKFGAEPMEGGIVDGQVVNLEPCFRTIHLQAFADGTVEHEAEFLPTDSGLKAWAQIQAKSGGFSSVISVKNGYGFHGFDFVREPNFSGNRPYTLDSANDESVPEVLVLDEVGDTVSASIQADYIDYLLDTAEQLKRDLALLRAENAQISAALSHLQADYDLALDDIVIAREKLAELRTPKTLTDRATLDAVIRQAEAFKTAAIVPLQAVENGGESAKTPLYSRWFGGK